MFIIYYILLYDAFIIYIQLFKDVIDKILIILYLVHILIIIYIFINYKMYEFMKYKIKIQNL